MRRFAICLGLTRLDPAGYDGWDGECPGCDVDAAKFAHLCHDAGFDFVSVGINQAVDHLFVKPAFLEICKRLKPDDLLVLFNSGHGGQQPDKDGDEADGLDETLCWWSGELVDDDIARYLSKIPKGVRTLFITDTCHSGTNFRGRVKYGKAKKRSRPVAFTESAELLRSSMLHFGGCSDDRYSYGDEDGGVFTQELIRTARASRKPLSYGEWFARAAKRMPKYQTPVIGIWGDDDFRDREMLT